MNKIKKVAAVFGLLLVMPVAAFAHGNDNDKNDGPKPPIQLKLANAKKIINSWPWRFHKSTGGTVTAVSSTGFNITGKDNKTYTVNTANAKLLTAYGTTISLSGIAVNDNAMVQGTLNGSQINASLVVVTPANTHPAKANGTVTAVSGGTVTLQSSHDGVVYPVTINTNASTTVTNNGATTTLSAITVGSKISVKGLWNEVLNVLNAIKIKIK